MGSVKYDINGQSRFILWNVVRPVTLFGEVPFPAVLWAMITSITDESF